MRPFRNSTKLLLMLVYGALANPASASDDAVDIRAKINHEFDRPYAVVVIDPIVIEQGYAIADWVQNETGGRALLQQKSGQWTIMLCSGNALKQANKIVDAGVPRAAANQLARRLSDAEKNIPPEKIKQFGMFGMEKQARDEHAKHH